MYTSKMKQTVYNSFFVISRIAVLHGNTEKSFHHLRKTFAGKYYIPVFFFTRYQQYWCLFFSLLDTNQNIEKSFLLCDTRAHKHRNHATYVVMMCPRVNSVNSLVSGSLGALNAHSWCDYHVGLTSSVSATVPIAHTLTAKVGPQRPAREPDSKTFLCFETILISFLGSLAPGIRICIGRGETKRGRRGLDEQI